MIIILFCCIFTSLFVFFTVYSMIINVGKMEILGRVHSAVEKRKSKSFIVPVIVYNAEKLGRIIARVKYKRFTAWIEKTGRILNSLGSKYERINPYQFFVLQLFAMVFGILFSVVFISMNVFIVLLCGLIFFFLPLLKIKEESKKRKEFIIKQLPDMTDLLSVMLDAGLDFYRASEKVIEVLDGPLIVEFKNALAKVSLGYDRKSALTDMFQRTEVEQLGFFVRTVNMALDSGTSMAHTLRHLAASLRNEKISLLEKKAQETPIKILIPLILLIFPTVFIVIFGPIAINFIRTGL